MHLQIENPEPRSHILKGVLKQSTHNPNARASQNYSIIEDLDQTPCAMSTLEVLQTCPSQRNSLLSALGSLDTCGYKVIKFNVTCVKPLLPYHVAFQIHVSYSKYTIKHIVIYEGVAMCMMSPICWKVIGYPTLSQYSTMLTTFDGHSFHPHGILPTFPVQLGGKTVEVDVEVVALLEANQSENKVYFGKEGMHDERDNWKEEKHIRMHEIPNAIRVRVFSIHCNGW
jgi:hypothetical protein